MSLFQELKRRNVFRVAVAYAVVGWLLVEVASVLFQTFEAPAWVMKVFATVIILGFPQLPSLPWVSGRKTWQLRSTSCRIPPSVGAWRSLVAHLSRGQGVGGSNPLAPTIY